MPHMQRLKLPLCYVRQSVQETRRHDDVNDAHPARRLPSRRRNPRPLFMDPPALDNCYVPAQPFPAATIRNKVVPVHVWEALPVLGVCRGLSKVDAAEYAAGEQSC